MVIESHQSPVLACASLPESSGSLFLTDDGHVSPIPAWRLAEITEPDRADFQR